ncbi:MAG: hypothetical protein ACP5GY_07615 [Vulcanisaeta sp.]
MDIAEAIKRITVDLCQRESCFQDYLATLLNAKARVVVNDVEVDVYGEHFAIEIKVNPRIYDGIGQALAYKRLLNINEVWLIHIFTYKINEELWCSNLRKLLINTSINYAVISPTNYCIKLND